MRRPMHMRILNHPPTSSSMEPTGPSQRRIQPPSRDPKNSCRQRTTCTLSVASPEHETAGIQSKTARRTRLHPKLKKRRLRSPPPSNIDELYEHQQSYTSFSFRRDSIDTSTRTIDPAVYPTCHGNTLTHDLLPITSRPLCTVPVGTSYLLAECYTCLLSYADF